MEGRRRRRWVTSGTPGMEGGERRGSRLGVRWGFAGDRPRLGWGEAVEATAEENLLRYGRRDRAR
uniref:Uncharacterized protein n=1 Tax=Oryza glumipatula TaxID=40148 RepID=A0A0D9ZYK7_9ORYZ